MRKIIISTLSVIAVIVLIWLMYTGLGDQIERYRQSKADFLESQRVVELSPNARDTLLSEKRSKLKEAEKAHRLNRTVEGAITRWNSACSKTLKDFSRIDIVPTEDSPIAREFFAHLESEFLSLYADEVDFYGERASKQSVVYHKLKERREDPNYYQRVTLVRCIWGG
jgi:hypothetical protein